VSYYQVTDAMYRPPEPALPGWAQAPVPGWGTNPWRAGPRRLAVEGYGADQAAVGGGAGAGIVIAGVVIGTVVLFAVLDAMRK
jgi:hypothetical protein